MHHPQPDGAQPTRKRGRPRKHEERPKPEPTRLERQTTQNLDQMLADLPTACDVGSKKNSKGYKETWIGYKLHLDVACGQIPVYADPIAQGLDLVFRAWGLKRLCQSNLGSCARHCESNFSGRLWLW